MKREQEIAQARAEFCEGRRHPDRLIRWTAWHYLRSLIEGWDAEIGGAYVILGEAEAWRRGLRPPTTFHEASARIRKRRRDGTLRGPGVGL